MTNLRDFWVSKNFLQGNVPTEISELTNLKELYLDHNSFRGSMPEEICALREKHLEALVTDCKKNFNCDCCTKCY